MIRKMCRSGDQIKGFYFLRREHLIMNGFRNILGYHTLVHIVSHVYYLQRNGKRVKKWIES